MSNIFRDPTEGATARRADLLRRRRDELVMMPHAIRRVFVARRARTAASIVVALLGAAMLVTAATPSLTAYLAKGLPGINPAVLSTFIVAMWICGLFAYAAARAVDEHRFAVAMSRLVMPGKDVNEDLERLAHENPDQAARDMAHRLEVRSAALPVLAAGVLLPVTALYIGAAVKAGGWPVIAEFEALVAVQSTKLILCSVAGVVLAFALTRRATRLPIVAPLMFGTATLAAGVGALTSRMWIVPVAIVMAYVAFIVRKLRKERDQLQAEDPAAGSEIWTIRGFIKQLRETAGAVRARIAKVPRRKLVVVGAIAAGAMAFFVMRPNQERQLKNYAASGPVMTAKAPQIDSAPTGTTTRVDLAGGGELTVTVNLADGNPFNIPALVNLRAVPTGWNMRVEIELLEGRALDVSPFSRGAMKSVSIGEQITISASSCDNLIDVPFGLHVQGEPGYYKLRLKPVLEPAGC